MISYLALHFISVSERKVRIINLRHLVFRRRIGQTAVIRVTLALRHKELADIYSQIKACPCLAALGCIGSRLNLALAVPLIALVEIGQDRSGFLLPCRASVERGIVFVAVLFVDCDGERSKFLAGLSRLADGIVYQITDNVSALNKSFLPLQI